MATTTAAAVETTLSIKLIIDKKNNNVLFAEANADFYNFLCGILIMPMASVITELKKDRMPGCLANVYQSVEQLSPNCLIPNQTKDNVLKAKSAIQVETVPLLTQTEPMTGPNRYQCGSGCCRQIFTNRNYAATVVYCPSCSSIAQRDLSLEGFVQRGSYMVMDNLEVSTVSALSLLKKFNIDSLNSIEEKVVTFGKEEGLKLLRASLVSETVLTDVFFPKRVRKQERML